jgi:agmatine/peptidylarginine deiminase
MAKELYESACEEVAHLAAAISGFEPVRLYAQPSDTAKAHSIVSHAIKQSCGKINNISITPCPIHHLWVRDTGPVYVRGTDEADRKTRLAINFNFNEWGKKKANGNNLNDGLNDIHPSPVTRIQSRLCLEGGGLMVDGEGTLLATESSIMNDNRNPGFSREEIEKELHRLLGVDKIIWFPGKKGLDVTDVHIDAEVNFIRPGVVTLSRPDPGAPKAWRQIHDEIHSTLKKATDAKGRPFDIHIIDEPQPEFLGSLSGDDAATSYVNLYFVNGGLIIPQFGDILRDQEAVELLQKLCPNRTVRPVHVRALPSMGGVIHCATQQVIDIDVD